MPESINLGGNLKKNVEDLGLKKIFENSKANINLNIQRYKYLTCILTENIEM